MKGNNDLLNSQTSKFGFGGIRVQNFWRAVRDCMDGWEVEV